MFTLEVGGAAADCTHTDLWGFDGVELPLLLLLSVENELMQNREMLGGGGDPHLPFSNNSTCSELSSRNVTDRKLWILYQLTFLKSFRSLKKIIIGEDLLQNKCRDGT